LLVQKVTDSESAAGLVVADGSLIRAVFTRQRVGITGGAIVELRRILKRVSVVALHTRRWLREINRSTIVQICHAGTPCNTGTDTPPLHIQARRLSDDVAGTPLAPFCRMASLSNQLAFFSCVTLALTVAPVLGQHPAPTTPGTPSGDMMPTQVLLDRAGFSPGEIDGRGGRNTRTAIAAFERDRRMTVADALAQATEPPTMSYTVTAEDAATPLARTIPEDMMEQSKLPRLDYTSLLEMLAERFHSSPALLTRLNPGARFVEGDRIVVPNVVVVSNAEAAPLPDITVRVSKRTSALTVTEANGKVIMHAPVTTGSQHDPLPIGSWTVTAVARNPTFNYNPDLFWDADPSHARAKLPPGPNGPVGVVWIDINKPHYGIHGTPQPQTVGHTTSNGCVRLTNWDALRLAAMVGKGTKVEFTP
jgi:lipoprotein-anchoring transpeptidase ErfK/SrfK